MKKYELTIAMRKQDSFEFASSDKIESDDLLEIVSQLLIVIVRLSRLEVGNTRRYVVDDDIPF